MTILPTRAVSVTLRIDNGTFAQATQLRITPLDGSTVQSLKDSAIWGIELEAFNYDGSASSTALRRPLTIELDVGSLVGATVQGTDILVYSADGENVRPVITSFGTADRVITVRLAQLGKLLLAVDQRR